MTGWISIALFALAGFGLLLIATQLVMLLRHLRSPPRRATTFPPISILKPLCGIDDNLIANLERFVALSYPCYELLLGVKNESDAAYAVALDFAARFPERVRVQKQRGEPGLNPKVNQLISLAAAARHQILVVSDSNVCVDADYLTEIAAHFEDPSVGLVTHAIAGAGAVRVGSLMDNLHVNSYVGPGVIATKRLLGKDIVVGKSMALRRGDLAAIGGFETLKDILAEDFVLGRYVTALLDKKVALASRPILNISERHTVADFYRRYCRWAVLHRQAIGTAAYMAELILNSTVVATLAVLFHPGTAEVAMFVAVCGLKMALDAACDRALHGERSPLLSALVVPAKDVVLAAAWVYGLFHDHVVWRGNKLKVYRGTWLERPDGQAELQAAQVY